MKALDYRRNTELNTKFYDYRNAAAMFNFTHKPITPDHSKASTIAMRMNQKSKIQKNKLEFLLNKTIGTKTIPAIDLNSIVDFPKLRDRITLGTFQPRLTKSYVKDILNHGSLYAVNNDILKDVNNQKLRADLISSRKKIIAMEILSRHSRGKKKNKNIEKPTKKLTPEYSRVYKVFLLYEPNKNNYKGIKGKQITDFYLSSNI